MTHVLPFNKDSKDRALNILVVGREKIIEPLSSVIFEENKTSNIIFNVKIHKCETVKQVLSSKRSPPLVDYVVFCLQSNSAKFIKQIEEDIGHLSKVFLLSRMCLVFGLYQSVSDLDTAAIMDFRQKYQLHVLNGKINEKDCCQELSRRILRLVSFACGLHTGYPHIEYRNYYMGERQESDFWDLSTSFKSEDQSDSSESVI